LIWSGLVEGGVRGKMRYRAGLGAAISMLMVSACVVPWPHSEYEIPQISGCVRGATSEPAVGVTVELSEPGGPVFWSGITDGGGAFYYPGLRKVRAFHYIGPGDRAAFVTLRFFDGDRQLFSEVVDAVVRGRREADEIPACFSLPAAGR